MASARARSTRPICAFHASGYSLAYSSTNRTSLSLYSMTHANTERPSRRAAWPPGVWHPPERGRLVPYGAFHASGYSLAHSSTNRTSLSLYSMTHANTERPSTRIRPPGVWHPPEPVDSSHMRLPCVRVFAGSLVYEPNITFTLLFYDPR